MTESKEPHPLLTEAIKRGAAAASQASAVMISEHEAMRLSTAILTAAEPTLRRHMMLEMAGNLERSIVTPTNGRALAEAIRVVVGHD
jgi:hypothetical protein